MVGSSFDQPIAVAPDHTFTLPRERKALDEDAVVQSERKAETMTWRADVRTPGLPSNERRLGDLRLECEVGMEAGLVSQYSVLDRVFDLLENSREYCSRREVRYLFFAERPLFSVTLKSGNRRETLSIEKLYAASINGRNKNELRYCDCEALLDRAYVLPLGDKSWPNDTRIELEYMDAPAEPIGENAAADACARVRERCRRCVSIPGTRSGRTATARPNSAFCSRLPASSRRRGCGRRKEAHPRLQVLVDEVVRALHPRCAVGGLRTAIVPLDV